MAERITTQDDDLFSEDLVRSYVSNPRFLRRDWLAADVNEKLERPDCRFVLITAEPGAGKSTFMAQLAADHSDWPRYFIRRDQRTPLGDVGARSFLLRIGYQLAARYPEAFAKENLQVAIQQRIGAAEAGSGVVAMEVNRIIASPFYRKVISIQQDIARSGGRVAGLKVKELFIERQLLDLSQLLNMAIIDPARALLKLRPKDRIVILVDALDEIRYQDITENILAWLTNCPDLPPNVRFVLSSRPPDEEIKLFCDKQAPHLSRLTIAEEDLHVKGDIEQFLNRLVGEPAIAQSLQEAKGGAETFASKAIDKARGNLGYLGALARGIDLSVDEMKSKDEDTRLRAQRMLDALLSLNELPADLEGLYAFFLKQIKASVARERIELKDPDTGETYDKAVWPAVYHPILGMLAVAAEPIDLELIEQLGGIRAERIWVSGALERLLQFLDVIDGRYRLYHATVAEFLTAPDTKSSTETADLYVDAVRWHGQIATYYWTRYHTDWSRCDDAYGLNSLATHLDRSEQFERLAELIGQPWMIARFNGGGYTYDGFIADLTLAWKHAYEETQNQIEARQAPRALAQCVRYALIRTSINSLSGNYAPELAARAVETGFWAPERALSVAARAPDAQQRSAMFSALIATGKLSGAPA